MTAGPIDSRHRPLGLNRVNGSRLFTAVLAALFVLMLVQPRGFVAVLSGLVPLVAVGMALVRRDLRPASASLAAIGLMAAASLVTLLMPAGEPLERLGQPWLMLLVGLAGFELLRRGRLPLAAWMPPAGLAVILLAWGVMVGLGASLPAFADGVNYAELSLVGHPFAKTLFLAAPAAWLLAALWYRASGRRARLWAFAVPLLLAVTSPSQSLSLGLLLGALAALFAPRPWLLVAATAAVLLLPAATVLVAPDLMARGLELPESWSWRVELWSEGLRLALERPLTGWGLQSYRELRDTLMELERVNHAHAIAVELLLDFGLWGLAGVLALGAGVAAAARHWGTTLGARFCAVPPLIAWLTITAISLGLWTDFVVAGTLFLLALATARVETGKSPGPP